ncbi:MAG: hypothetical protein CMF50_09480 [Legionellales bacterium]|nr:hypothetical protein [Legionellales bacterium]
MRWHQWFIIKIEAIAMLKAAFRHKPRDYNTLVTNATIILLISPGQEYHEGEKFKATVELLNRSGFAKCHVMVGDTNYRHTLQIEHKSPNDCYWRAKIMGQHWVARNSNILQQLAIPYEIFHWDRWLCHPRYNDYKQQVDNLFDNEPSFREAFLFSANKFVRRFCNADIDIHFAIQQSLEYLKEECAVIMPLWAELGYQHIVYPGNMLKAMETTYQQTVLPMKRLIYWYPLRFKRLVEAEDSVCNYKQVA